MTRALHDILNALLFAVVVLTLALFINLERKHQMKNWKTTLAGIAAAIGAPLAATGEGWVKVLGIALTTVGTGLLGVHAADGSK